MRAVVLRALGEPEELVVEDVPAPTPGEGQVLLEVKAAALNFVEVLVRRGIYPQMPELPWVPGAEVAGVTTDGRRLHRTVSPKKHSGSLPVIGYKDGVTVSVIGLSADGRRGPTVRAKARRKT